MSMVRSENEESDCSWDEMPVGDRPGGVAASTPADDRPGVTPPPEDRPGVTPPADEGIRVPPCLTRRGDLRYL